MPTQVILRLKQTHSLSYCKSLQCGRSALLNGHSSLLRTDFFAHAKIPKVMSILPKFGYNHLKQNHNFQGKYGWSLLLNTSQFALSQCCQIMMFANCWLQVVQPLSRSISLRIKWERPFYMGKSLVQAFRYLGRCKEKWKTTQRRGGKREKELPLFPLPSSFCATLHHLNAGNKLAFSSFSFALSPYLNP